MATGRVPTTANSPLTAKGDLFTYSTAPARLAVGSNGDTIVADSSTSTGLRYQASYAAGKNIIINGGMDFDQRNSGAVFTPANNSYGLDRWRFGSTQASKVSTQQITSTIAGFAYSMKITSLSAYTPTANDEIEWFQNVEAGQIANFAWGTASAKTAVLSFWVKSSLTGTFGGSIVNGATDYSYPFTYTINAANTAEYKTVVITAPTAGTWTPTGVGVGVKVFFSLGAAGTSLGTAGAWAASFKVGATGQTNLVATNGATLELTGVQMELANAATAFSRAGGTIQGELAACQRYYWRTTTGGQLYSLFSQWGTATSSTLLFSSVVTPVTMRITPSSVDFASLRVFGQSTGVYNSISAVALDGAGSSLNLMQVQLTSSGMTTNSTYGFGGNNSATAYIAFNSEL